MNQASEDIPLLRSKKELSDPQEFMISEHPMAKSSNHRTMARLPAKQPSGLSVSNKTPQLKKIEAKTPLKANSQLEMYSRSKFKDKISKRSQPLSINYEQASTSGSLITIPEVGRSWWRSIFR